MPKPHARLICGGCGYEAPANALLVFRCPNAATNDDIDHLIEVLLPKTYGSIDVDPNPFIRYRTRSFAYAKARELGMSDAGYVKLVRKLNAAVADTCGTGFHITTWANDAAFEAKTGHSFEYKDETGNVAGSHKARHLFGLAILIEVAEQSGLCPPGELGSPGQPLSIASCGNAALAAAVIANAWRRSLQVFIPTNADPRVVSELDRLGADIVTCQRTATSPPGDPCVHAFREAVNTGSVPFTCQGPENGLVIDGGKTLGYELAETFTNKGVPDRLFLQVGGGALASATCQALEQTLGLEGMPMIHAVQTEACHPLKIAFEQLRKELNGAVPTPTFFKKMRRHRSRFMRPVTNLEKSLATGILDDETYDWFAIARAMLLTSGAPITVTESQLADAREHAAPPADATGAAGLAGFLAILDEGDLALGESVAVIFTGIDRTITTQ